MSEKVMTYEQLVDLARRTNYAALSCLVEGKTDFIEKYNTSIGLMVIIADEYFGVNKEDFMQAVEAR